MSRTIPVALQAHLNLATTTRCRLLRIQARDGDVVAFSSTNRAITYDDGAGALVYQVQSGFDMSAIVSTSDTAVDNAAARIVMLGDQVSETSVIAGKFDGAEWSVYEVNYADLTMGHVPIGHGYLGRPKIGKGGGWVSFELRALTDLLRQVPWDKFQRRCRVRVFGSQPGDERFPCMYDLTGEWVSATVTAVGVESDRTFTASSLGQAADYFAPGMVLATSGPFEGLSFEVESFAAGVVTLTFPTPYPVPNGMTFDIRRECSREWEGHNSCDTFGNRPWYRGEPRISAADGAAAQIPGAQTSPGSGGRTTVPDALEEA